MGLFELQNFEFKYYDGYIEVGATPTFEDPHWIDFIPIPKTDPYNANDVFEEWISTNGGYSNSTIRFYNVIELLSNQMQI